MAPPGILSSISSWWGTGSSTPGGPSSSSSSSSYYHGPNGKSGTGKSPYSSSYSAWTTSPYNERGAGAAANYPPQPRTSFSMARPSASVADFTNMYPAGSTSNLVSPHTPGTASYEHSRFHGTGPDGSGINTPRYSTSSPLRPAISSGSNMVPSNAYPPLRHTWNRIQKWARRNYTELYDTLNWPASDAQIDALEMTIGMALPPAVRESYLCYNGQETESKQSCSDGLFFGLTLLSLDRIAEEWNFWRNVDDDPATGANADVNAAMASCPDGWVRPVYSSRGWIPLISDNVGNYIGVDLHPHPSGAGSPGQVIAFGRDLDTKVVLWRGDGEGGWGRFLQSFAEELEAAECYTLGDDGETGSSGEEEDSIGYEPYFSNGGAGASRGLGDRGGDGAYGFRLTGEYKGWPVIEAWADRSMRFWQTVGLQAGMPNGGPEARQRYLDGLDGPNGVVAPRVRVAEAIDEEDDAFVAARDQIAAVAAATAAAAAAAGAGQVSPQDASSSSSMASPQHLTTEDHAPPPSSLPASQAHPLEDTDLSAASRTDGSQDDGEAGAAVEDGKEESGTRAVPLIYTDDSGVSDTNPTSDAASSANGLTSAGAAAVTGTARNLNDTLSPPMPSTKGWRAKQKQRELDPSQRNAAAAARSAAGAAAAANRRRSPPVPAAPIDLPTLEEVLSEQAAVLAEDGGPPLDASEVYTARSTVPLAGSGGVAALLPTALGGVGGLSRVLSSGSGSGSRRASGKRHSSSGAGVGGGVVEGGRSGGWWDGARQGSHSGLASPVHRDSITPLGSPRRSADEGHGSGAGMGTGTSERASWSLASAAAAGLGVLGTSLSGQRSPRQSFTGGGGHGAEGSSGSAGSAGRGPAEFSGVRVVGGRPDEEAVELNSRVSLDDAPSSGRALFAADGSLGGSARGGYGYGYGHGHVPSSRLQAKAQPPLPTSVLEESSGDSSIDPLVATSSSPAQDAAQLASTASGAAGAARRRDLSHRSPIHSPNLRGQYDADVFTPADRVPGGELRPLPNGTAVAQGAVVDADAGKTNVGGTTTTTTTTSSAQLEASTLATPAEPPALSKTSNATAARGASLLIDAADSPLTEETPVALSKTEVDA